MWVWDVDSIPTPHKNTGGFSYALPKKYTWYLLVTKCYPYCNPSQSCEHWLGWTLTAAEATSLDRPCDSRARQSSSPVLTLWGITQRLVSGFRVVQNCTLRITFVVTSPNATYHCLIWNRLLTIDTDGKVSASVVSTHTARRQTKQPRTNSLVDNTANCLTCGPGVRVVKK